MGSVLGRSWWRNASVLLWTPVLLVAPVLEVRGSAAAVALQVALVAAIGVSAYVAALTGGPPWRDRRPAPALAVLVLATCLAATQGSSQWLPTWVLLANALPTGLRGRWLVGAVPAVTVASALAAWSVAPHELGRVLLEAFVVLLAGVAASALTTLVDTVAELRRTRQELALAAVAEERERFSRDLHDLLGHTLSVMVVKAQAVRRVVDHDPRAAAEHAADIEQVGRQALTDVRQAVDAMRAPRIAEELDGVRRALDAAGITTTVEWPDGEVTDDAALAWALREGVTNVLRHSGAGRCQIRLVEEDGRRELTITDDGVGRPTVRTTRSGGLAGLEDRLAASGGELVVEPGADGFRLVATVPVVS